MPDILKYDGTTDPRDHVTAFTTGVKGNDLTKQEIESVLVKKFGETLTKGVLTWYSLLPENSINSFVELADSFIKAHSGAQKVEKRMEDIFKIKQGDSELLRDFVDRFQRERMTLPRVPDNRAAIAFASNLNDKSSKATEDLKKAFESFRQPRGMTFITGIVRNCELRKISCLSFVMKREATPGDQKPKKYQVSQRYDQKSRNRESGSSSRFRNDRNRQESRDNDSSLKARFGGYNFNVTTSELVAVLRSMGDKEPPKPPSPKRTVNVITGGEDIHGITYMASNKVSKVTITHRKRVRQVLENESISFDDADTEGIMTPHNNALVISLLVYDTNVKRVLIDPGSSVNIILLRVLREMQAEDKMIPKAHTLSGFDNSSVVTKGEHGTMPDDKGKAYALRKKLLVIVYIEEIFIERCLMDH
ncbi:uncharacterized protein [Nicotiana sylvestris]|uniref:uncharacterized protein n=1 Tax=Nicotiana sylvestris TaxID=4096 RepID=UPI00388C5000